MKKILLFFLIFCFVFNNGSAYAVALSEPTNSLIPQCEQIDESKLRVELNHVIQGFLNSQTNTNFQENVNRQWQTLNLDSAIDSEIDNAIVMVNNNTGLVNRFKSSWVPSKAEALTNEVTEIAFNSPSLKSKLTQLSKNVSEELTNQLEMTSAKSSSYTIDCLQQFIGRQYSQTFVNIFSKNIKDLEVNADLVNSLKPDTTQYIYKHSGGISGGAILAIAITSKIRKKVVTTIVDRVFQQVGERVLGRLATGVVPFIGEISGGILILSDLIKSFDGALPEIQKILKAPNVKQAIQKEIATTVEQEIRTENSQIAREVSNDVYASWLDFQKDYRDVLSLSSELPEFKEILSKTADLSKITLLVGITLNNMGRNQVPASIKNGAFERVLSLPETSYKIIQTTRDLNTLVDWANLAGNRIEDIVNLEIYKNLSPKDLDRQTLLEILDIKDSSTISKITLLNIDSIRKLLSISKQNLVALSKQLSPEDLQRLSSYLGELKQPQINQLVKFLINDDPSIIKNTSVMAHIVRSREINAAIEFWEAPGNLMLFVTGMLKMSIGAISWNLIADKFGTVTTVFSTGIPILIFLGLLSIICIWVYRRFKKSQAQQTLG